jgi:membrane fusion protein, multidrug efflux system
MPEARSRVQKRTFNALHWSASARRRSLQPNRQPGKSSNSRLRTKSVFKPCEQAVRPKLIRQRPLLASRQADFQRARAHLDSACTELEAQRRQRAVLDSQEQTLLADQRVRQAALELARTNLGYTRIVAPANGIVGERKVRAGQFVSPGTQIISLVEKQIWVQANYRETQLLRIRTGDPAEIRVDAFPGLTLKGHVEELAPASGSQFALLPPDNATGNFTKVTQRVPVKIVLDGHQDGMERLRPGLSVVASIRTKG